MKTAILVYEVTQLKDLERFLATESKNHAEQTVIALGADVEYVLAKRGIDFESGKELRYNKHSAFVSFVEKLGQGVLDDPSFSFFSYRGVPLTKVFMNGLQNYLILVLYFLDVLTSIVEDSRYGRLILFPSSEVVLEGGILATLEKTALLDAARTVSAKYGTIIVFPEQMPLSMFVRTRLTVASFTFKRALFGSVLWFLNAFVTLVIPRKNIRILASEYWRNIYALLYALSEAEVLLLDRGESRKAGLRAIWRHRMRFIHIKNFISLRMRREARRARNAFEKEWRQRKDSNTVLQGAQFREHDIAPLLSAALKRLVGEGSERAVRTIDGSYAMLKRLRPELVWVRASVSGQIHFPILCHVARSLGIPSLEIQHGIFFLGEGSFFDRPPAQFVATYGPRASGELKRFGYTNEHLINIGSPRFDVYAKTPSLKPLPGHFTIACIMPAVIPQSWSDSYEIVEYLRNLKAAVKRIPNVRLILKLRPGPDNEAFYREAIARELQGIPHVVAQYEPVVDVFAQSDAILAIFSTTVLEALISGKPTVYNGTVGMHGELVKELAAHAEAGALYIAKSVHALSESLELLARDPEVRRTMVEKAKGFMKAQYSFDGRASQKLAEAIRGLVQKPEKAY